MNNIPFPKVIATVQLQRWVGRKEDQLENLRNVEFDATSAVLALSFDGLRELEDSQDSADEIVRESHCREFENHDGPFDVLVSDAIDLFLEALGVDGLESLTPGAWGEIQKAYKAAMPAESLLSVPLSDEQRGLIIDHLVERKAASWSYEISESGLMTELRNRALYGFKGYHNMTDEELLNEARGETVQGLGLVLKRE